jgi:hypothetical protein
MKSGFEGAEGNVKPKFQYVQNNKLLPTIIGDEI